MPESFLDLLERHGREKPLPRGGSAGPAAQGVQPGLGRSEERRWEFAFATGIECSNPTIVDRDGRRVRRDLLEECGHYERWREDLQLVKELGIPCLRYGLPIHRVHLGPGRYDWSFPDAALEEIRRLGITPILDLLHFSFYRNSAGSPLSHTARCSS